MVTTTTNTGLGTQWVQVSGECMCAHRAPPVLLLGPSPLPGFRVWLWVCECVCNAYAPSQVGREAGKSGYKILPNMGLQRTRSPNPAWVYRTPEPLKGTSPGLCRCRGGENRDCWEGVHLGKALGALRQISKMRHGRSLEWGGHGRQSGAPSAGLG